MTVNNDEITLSQESIHNLLIKGLFVKNSTTRTKSLRENKATVSTSPKIVVFRENKF